jgi:hypothetical protein
VTYRILLILSLVLAAATVGLGIECSQFTRCSECITQSPHCAWCDDLETFQRYASNTTDLSPAPFCGTPEDLETVLGCPRILNPQSLAQATEADSSVETLSSPQVSPSSAELTLRPGVPGVFNITVAPSASFSVDMYFLMDLTLTMVQDLNNLKTFSAELVSLMQGLTDDFRIAYGSFIDKAVPPFSDRFNPDFPCALDVGVISGLNRSTCDSTYAFRHRLDFTDDASAFAAQVKQSLVSASPDAPESILDAIMQIAVCEEQVGWRPQGQSRRLIFALTDGDYHYALDGKLGGITERPDFQCHLDGNMEYSYQNRHDFPSAAALAGVLNEKSIVPIFAVENNVRGVYDQLSDVIRSAFVTTRTANSDNLLEVLRSEYIELSGTVVPVISGLDNTSFSIELVPMDNCSQGSLRANSTDICEGITSPDAVTYSVRVTASPDACRDPDQTVSARIQFVGFGEVELSIRLVCDCGCEATAEAGSSECEGEGVLECSTCQCPEQLTGPQCTCPTSTGALQGCRANLLDPVCSGRGTCVCGECMCDSVDQSDGSVRYHGDYCQHDPTDCPVGRDDSGLLTPCSSRGSCVDGVCECNGHFTGVSCECTSNITSCINPSDPDSGVCSGEGRCVCGLCLCDDYSQRHGQYCEECGPCRTSCSKINPCVACDTTRGKSCSEDDNCTRITLLDRTPVGTNFKTCSVIEAGCEVRFHVDRLVTGDEDQIVVYFDRNQSNARTLRDNPDECSPQLLIWPIPVGIILGVLLIGLITIIVWRGLTYVGEYLEYRQWLKSYRGETSRSEPNPVYVDPGTDHPNPRYMGGRSPAT